jgi:hypothetical protein
MLTLYNNDIEKTKKIANSSMQLALYKTVEMLLDNDLKP